LTYNITRVQTHSKIPSGSFSLQLGEDKEVAVPFNADITTMQNNLQLADPTYTVSIY
jgi:hypothetical protein